MAQINIVRVDGMTSEDMLNVGIDLGTTGHTHIISHTHEWLITCNDSKLEVTEEDIAGIIEDANDMVDRPYHYGLESGYTVTIVD